MGCSLKGIALFVKKPNHRLITAWDLILFTDEALKGFGRPKCSLRLWWLINQFHPFAGLLIIDNGHST
jgi:hypothetical protein